MDGQSKFKLRIKKEITRIHLLYEDFWDKWKGQVPQPRQKGELLAQVTYAFDSEQIVTVTVSDPRGNTVVARFSQCTVNQTQEWLRKICQNFKLFLLNSSHDRLLQSN